ncbi:MAG: hypothetical protein WAK71_18855, partial [Streptosporangiaceae bacterium]
MTDSGHEAAVDPAGPAGTAVQPDSSTVALPAVPFGEWPSPITAAEVASGQVKVSAPMVLGSDAWWQQGLPDEGGRTTVMHSSGGKQTALLAAPWNVRTRVHEYGGRSYLPVPRSATSGAKTAKGYQLLFVNYADQRLYLTGTGTEEPAPLTPDPVTVPATTGGSGTPAT